MRLKIFLSAIILGYNMIASAQTNGLKFQSSFATGFIAGAGGPALQLQSINGVKFKSWSAGIGVGLDYYHSRTIPVFIDVRKALTHKAKTPFVYVDGGYNFRWLERIEKEGFVTEAKGGLYYDAGVGYQLPILKTHSLFFTLGYSGKHISNTEQLWYFIDYIWPGPSSPSNDQYHYKYKLQRLCLKAGFRF